MSEDEVPARQGGKKYRGLGWWALLCRRCFLVAMPVLGVLFILGVHTRLGLMLFREQYVGLFLALTLSSVFLGTRPGRRSTPDQIPWYDILLTLGALVVGLYMAVFYPAISALLGIVTPIRIALGGLAVLLILEATRRVVGWSVVIIVSLLILYARFKYIFPGLIGGKATPWDDLMNYLYLDPNSMPSMVAIAATIGLAFILFGQIAITFGGGKFFADLAFAALGRFRGGAAKAAVVGSSLVGTITGGPVTNVMLVGTITIPMMKNTGYRAVMAGAIEAVASTGGQIMPPVMGIAAFLIAEFLSISYAKVALAAFIPACLYYAMLFIQVDLEAAKAGIRGLPPDQVPRLVPALKRGWLFILVLLVLVYTLFIMALDPATAGAVTSLFTLALVTILKENRVRFWSKLLTVLEGTGRVLVDIGVILAAAGLIVGVMGVSGLGFSMSIGLIHLAGGNVLLLLIMAALVCFILGMGMPTVAAYALVAILVAPALIELGILPLAAHLFIFYWGIIANISPPVAVASFAAAALAGANPISVGFLACRLAVLVYIVPFLFVFQPALILEGSVPQIILSVVISLLACWSLGAAFVGYLYRNIRWWNRSLLGLGAVGLMLSLCIPDSTFRLVSGVAGGIIALSVLFFERYRRHGAIRKAVVTQ